MPQMPAARLTDMCQHGGTIVGPGATKTMIEMLPAARITDNHVCPMVTGVVPHVGGPIITGAFTVLVEFMPLSRVMEKLVCVGPPDMIAKGASKTMVGDGGGGGGAVAAGAAAGAAAAAAAAATGVPGELPPFPAPPGGPGQAASGTADNAASSDQCTTEGDPIDVATGRMILSVEDFTTQGTPSFSFLRFYSTSGSHLHSDCGYGWTHTLNETLEIGPDFLTYHTWEGRKILFVKPAKAEEITAARQACLEPEILALLPEAEDDITVHHKDEDLTLYSEGETYAIEKTDGTKLHFALVPGTNRARLVAIEGADGSEVTLEYGGDRLAGLTDKLGNRYRFESEDRKHITAISFQSPEMRTPLTLAQYLYDKAGHLVQMTDALNFQTRYHYDHLHRMVQKVDRNGYQFFWQYDSKNRCTRTWGQDGLFDQTFLYDADYPMTTVRDQKGRQTAYIYNDLGMVTEVVDAQGNREKYEYAASRLVKKTDANGRTTEYAYDPFGRVIGIKTPGGAERTFAFAPDGSQIVTDAEGNVLMTLADGGAMITKLADADTPFLVRTYDAETKTATIADADSNETKLEYDEADRLTALQHPLGQKFAFAYDARGNRVQMTDPTGGVVHYRYDALNRLVGVEREGESGFQFQYDNEGNLAYFVDGNGRTTRYEHAGYEKLTAVSDPLGNTARFHYDEYNRLIEIADPLKAKTTFAYDAVGRVQRVLYPDGRSDYLTYDPAGQITRFLDRGGVATDCTYDDDGRLTLARFIDGTQVAYTYDKNGRILSATNDTCEVAFGYDALGRLVSEATDGATVLYEYDANGALVGLTTPAEETVRFAYDKNGRLEKVTDMDGGVHAFVYADNGPLESHRYPNGLTAKYTNSRLGLPMQVAVGPARSPRPDFQCAYRYDGNDNVVESADSVTGRVAYRYDAAGRIQQVSHENAALNERFGYDANGNMTERNEIRGLLYDSCNRFNGGYGQTCFHDEHGNITAYQDGQSALQMQFDAAGNVIKFALPDGRDVVCAYDAFGRRLRKQVGDVTTNYLWAGDQLLAEMTDGEPGESRWYVWLPGTFTPLGMRVDGDWFYFHNDHRNAPTRITDAAGGLVWLADYTAFGAARVRVAEIENHLRLPGQQVDAETGLHYNRARYYQPQWGRYVSPDPAKFAAGLNWYAYAANDPLNKIDPLGMKPKSNPQSGSGAAAGSGANEAGENACTPEAPCCGNPADDKKKENPTASTCTPKQDAQNDAAGGSSPADSSNQPAPAQGGGSCSQGGNAGGAGAANTNQTTQQASGQSASGGSGCDGGANSSGNSTGSSSDNSAASTAKSATPPQTECEKKKDEIDKFLEDYKAMITRARAKGANVAADNLQHFLDGSGSARQLDPKWLRDFGVVQSAEKDILNWFESKANSKGKSLTIVAESLKDGETATFTDNWDRAIDAHVWSELYYASGKSELSSKGEFVLSRNGNTVTIKGTVKHHWHDPYDWNPGMAAYIPGTGVFPDDAGVLMQKCRGAKSFLLESDWMHTLQATITLRQYLPNSHDFDWQVSSGGASGSW